VAGYTLRRGEARASGALRATLFDVSYAARHVELAREVERLEAKLRAIEEHPEIDDAALRAATTHTRLVCSARGYVLAEVDAPPPPCGAEVEHEGTPYTVLRIGPSPLPGDVRRCAVLV
jgi:hypothetical protein